VTPVLDLVIVSSTTAVRMMSLLHHHQQHLLAAVPLFLVALSKLLVIAYYEERRKRIKLLMMIIIIYVVSTVSLFLLGQPSAIFTVVCCSPLTMLLSQWTRFVATNNSNNNNNETKNQPQHHKHAPAGWIQGLVFGGPLGHGCGKALEVLAAALLWKMARGRLPESIGATFAFVPAFAAVAPAQDWTLILGILLLALAVNGVLAAWSHWVNNNNSNNDRRGVHQHEGVQRMVSPTLGRSLSVREHARLLALAVANALCEECTARGFWRHEMECTAKLMLSWQSNAAQAIVFGAWHYYGIPSGWTGVALTTVYGGIMGYLADLQPSTGLWLPILAHSIADYYIFAVIARQKKRKSD